MYIICDNFIYLFIYKSSFSPCLQVHDLVDVSEVEEFSEVASKPMMPLAYDSPRQTFVAFEKLEGALSTIKFSKYVEICCERGIVQNFYVFAISLRTSLFSVYSQISCFSPWINLFEIYLTVLGNNNLLALLSPAKNNPVSQQLLVTCEFFVWEK